VTKHIPVVAVSAFAMKEDSERAARAGCSGYLTKPLDLKVFVEEVQRHIGNPEAEVREP